MSILDSDIGLWEQHTIKERDKSGGITATLADDAYPPGWSDNIITGRLVGDNPRQLIVSWHKYVSGRIHAWENSQEAAALKRAEASRTSGLREDAASEQPAGRNAAAPSGVSDGEETLEAILESKVATLRRSIASIEEAIAGTEASLGVLRDRRVEVNKQLTKVQLAFHAISDSGNSGERGPEVHSENSRANVGTDPVTASSNEAGTSGLGRVPSRRGRPVGSRDSKPRVRNRDKGVPTGQPELDRVQEPEHSDSGSGG